MKNQLPISLCEKSFDYAYDPIGNRTSATEYDESGAPLPSAYAANALNQYTSRTVPGYAAVRGEADTNAFVTVNERPVSRTGAYFHGGDYADNTVSNLYHDLEIYAAINPPGTNVSDTVYAVTSSVFIAKTPETFTYDADGNMISDGRFTYTWNADNRMVCTSNAEVVVTYAYDHRGRMVRKDIKHRGTETQRVEYTWDNWNIVREAHVSRLASRVTHNVWGLDLDGNLQGAGGVGGLLAVIVPRPMGEGQGEGGTAYMPCYDANGNISEYVTTNGEVVAHYDYSPFGEQLVVRGLLADTFTHRFSTKPWCAVTGFSEYQMRKYKPEIGRWMSRDPLEEEQYSQSPYNFVSNMPIEYIDMFGLWGCAPNYPLPEQTECCGESEYNPKTQCCIEEEHIPLEYLLSFDDTSSESQNDGEIIPGKQFVVYDKNPIGTGVSIGRWQGNFNGRRNVVHQWIIWPGGSADANALDNKIVFSPALRVYSSFERNVTIKEIELSQCEYDVHAFSACVIQLAKSWHGKPFGMCHEFVEYLVSSCKREAKR